MHHYNPNSEWDRNDAQELNAEDWMLDLVQVNPSYTSWGPGQDYMAHTKEGWGGNMVFKSWKKFGDFKLDEFNEIVNFYFEIDRPSVSCGTCEGMGNHPDARWIRDSFYNAGSPFRQMSQQVYDMMRTYQSAFNMYEAELHRDSIFPSEDVLSKYGDEFRQFCESMYYSDVYWEDKITDDEFEALVSNGRNRGFSSASEMNEAIASREPGSALIHDSINHSILVQQRCERLGVPHKCPRCEGKGYQFTTDKATVNLILWVLHPRKSVSRGATIENIQYEELGEIFSFLKQAAQRNIQRFMGVVAPSQYMDNPITSDTSEEFPQI